MATKITEDKHLRPDIIDNRDIYMYGVLNTNLPGLDGLDISSGFFDVKGYGLVHKELEAALEKPKFTLRLLLGSNAITTSAESFEDYKKRMGPELEENLPLLYDLGMQNMNREILDDTHRLIKILDMDNVHVRRNSKGFNHSKCYIFNSKHKGVIIGSSNFTGNGLAKNYELNAGLYQTAPHDAAKKWFNDMWSRAEDIKHELKTVLLESKFGRPPGPFEVYIKMIFEMFKDKIKATDDKSDSARLLTRFQKDAVDMAIQIINDHDGVIIADSTGLGKTNMGMSIMRRKHFNENKKTLLIAPAQVLDSMWAAKLEEEGIVAKQKSMESLGQEGFSDEMHKYKKYDLVVIDESQNFRSKGANRRLNLMKLMSVGKKKQAVLLTATPINNSIMDLYYQLSIITGGDDAHFADSVGISDLYRHMRDAANRNKFQDCLEKIQQLLDSTMIRRTRTYIQDVYKGDKIDGNDIKFPDHQFSPVHYSMTDLYDNIFAKIKKIDELNMVPYCIKSYNESLDEKEKQKSRLVGYLQRTTLLKRFESSKIAAEASIKSMIRLYEHVKYVINGGNLPDVKVLTKILNKYHNTDEDENYSDRIDDMMQEIESMDKQQSARGYNIDKMKEHIEMDLKKLNEFKLALENITIDKKLIAVYEKIVKDRALETESKKVLIFTEYVTTANYLKEELVKLFPSKEILLITGATAPKQRNVIIKRFAPQANLVEDDDPDVQEADILISTEVLSEGQNLQDCNYVINYDLPWNPMRIVQRRGRVDRLTSKYDTIRSRACYPAKELDEILNLMAKLIDKIHVANEAIGLGAELLGVEPKERQFNENSVSIKKLADAVDVRDELERLQHDSDMILANSPFNMVNKEVKTRGIDIMEKMPMGRRSGIRGNGQKVVLGYLEEEPKRKFHFVLYDYKNSQAKVISSQTDALKMISCTDKTPIHLPMDSDDHKMSFMQLLSIDNLARKAIEEDYEQLRKDAILWQNNRANRHKKKIEEFSELLWTANDNDELSSDDCKELIGILKSVHLVNWEDDIDKIFAIYKKKNDLENLKRGIRRLGNLVDVDKKDAKYDKPLQKQKPDLKLVGAMFITGDKFDFNAGKDRLDKYTPS